MQNHHEYGTIAAPAHLVGAQQQQDQPLLAGSSKRGNTTRNLIIAVAVFLLLAGVVLGVVFALRHKSKNDDNNNTPTRPPHSATYNVFDFGALGDGVHDDTAAVIAATAAMQTSNVSALQLYFPSGFTYLLNSSAPEGYINIFSTGPSNTTTARSYQIGSDSVDKTATIVWNPEIGSLFNFSNTTSAEQPSARVQFLIVQVVKSMASTKKKTTDADSYSPLASISQQFDLLFIQCTFNGIPYTSDDLTLFSITHASSLRLSYSQINNFARVVSASNMTVSSRGMNVTLLLGQNVITSVREVARIETRNATEQLKSDYSPPSTHFRISESNCTECDTVVHASGEGEVQVIIDDCNFVGSNISSSTFTNDDETRFQIDLDSTLAPTSSLTVVNSLFSDHTSTSSTGFVNHESGMLTVTSTVFIGGRIAIQSLNATGAPLVPTPTRQISIQSSNFTSQSSHSIIGSSIAQNIAVTFNGCTGKNATMLLDCHNMAGCFSFGNSQGCGVNDTKSA